MPFLKLKWESLYVALSRIRTRDDMCLLLRRNDRSTMGYVSELRKDEKVKCFLKGTLKQTTVIVCFLFVGMQQEHAGQQDLFDMTKKAFLGSDVVVRNSK